ncbi:MAG: NAD/FAD-binding protein [Alphaproteobacteria bacterium]|nr:NAD/FAD-binding protein [Alphaproteobacteria bacterium]
MKFAVIGAGIAGLGAAYILGQRHRVRLFERNCYLGGHSNTVDVEIDGRSCPVDTGFIVYNERNYPNLTRLFAHLEVPTESSDMSFAVSVERPGESHALEYGGGSLSQLFAQKRNLHDPRFLGMIADILRFFVGARRLLASGGEHEVTLGAYLARGRYGDAFVYDHLLPMAAAIWSCPFATMLDFPAASFARFLHNHGLLSLANRPRWRTVSGGSREYVRRLTRLFSIDARTAMPAVAVERDGHGVVVRDASGASERFDHVVIATHADEALALLAQPSDEERRLLGAFRYQRNRAVLHRDERLMPHDRRVWSSWNYMAAGGRDSSRRVAVTYWMNMLQNIDWSHQLFVSLNPVVEPRPDMTLRSFDYDHPVFDVGAVRAQAELARIQGVSRVSYCGSYCGYGFHEDALSSAIAVTRGLGVAPPWEIDPAPAPVLAPAEALPGPALAAASDD